MERSCLNGIFSIHRFTRQRNDKTRCFAELQFIGQGVDSLGDHPMIRNPSHRFPSNRIFLSDTRGVSAGAEDCGIILRPLPGSNIYPVSRSFSCRCSVDCRIFDKADAESPDRSMKLMLTNKTGPGNSDACYQLKGVKLCLIR
jgi:hypothetical protein